MTWTATQGSAIFQAALVNPLTATASNTTKPTSFASLTADALTCALFGNAGTPDKTAAVASTGYNTGQWLTASDEATGTGYTAGGQALTSLAFSLDTGSSSVLFKAANPSWTTVTLSNVYGDLIYDATITGGTVAKQGMCFNYFGGAQSVTAGTFTVQWPTPSGAATTAVFNISV